MLVTDDEMHAKQKKMLGPAFHHENIRALADKVVPDCVNTLVKILDEKATSGEVFDIYPLLRALTFTITGNVPNSLVYQSRKSFF